MAFGGDWSLPRDTLNVLLQSAARQREEGKRKLLCAQVEKEKNKTGSIKTHHTHLCELKPQCTSVPVCRGGAGCSTHTCFLNRPRDGAVNDTMFKIIDQQLD